MICEDVNGRHGAPTQLKACVSRLIHYAKTNGTAFWLIGHFTRGDDIAGPKTIQHDVDVVLELSRGQKIDGTERILRCPHKNRFGPTNTSGHLELTAKGFVAVCA
jgi:DNA repair protein RadA/Sms